MKTVFNEIPTVQTFSRTEQMQLVVDPLAHAPDSVAWIADDVLHVNIRAPSLYRHAVITCQFFIKKKAA